MTIDTQVIRAEPHAEIGGLIEHNIEAIVDTWIVRAMAEQPSARRAHYAAIRDDLPKFLRVMSRALTQAGHTGANEHCLPALDHGEQRWQEGWSLAEVVRDYQLLHLVLLEFLEKSLDRALHYRETMAVSVFIHDAVAASIASYVAQRDAEMQKAEKERTAALQTVARGKDEFMAVLGHELRNPLAPISNSVTLVRTVLATPPPAVATAIAVIERQTKQLVRLVDDILDVARIGLGRLELRITRIDLTTVLEDAAHSSGPMLAAKQHRLTVVRPVQPVMLDADRERLVQVICNLLNNAAKYTPDGGRVELIGEADGDEAIVRVRDNGLGIAPEMLGRIFDPFTQADTSREYSDGGLGIGLMLVRRLVEQHGGSVSCSSDGPGKGSEFVVRLPTTRAVEASMKIVERAADKPR